ncbi:efflux RND transporter permease subunit [Petrimonas sulfuriphila]|jgi:predicted RND superfamily exporter protein|uniref:efflux RND transporter permease subunit n=1 Tax=Petrimonas sulfuriphila TaxID=285070 RepID=UPI003EB9C8B2
MNRFAESIVKFKWLIIIAVAGLTVFFSYQVKDLHINSDIISSLPDDDPAARLYKEIGTQFGGNDMGLIVLETDDVFKAEVIQRIKQITDSLKYTNGISSVTSLTNILDIKSSDWGIEIGKLVDEYDLPIEQSQLDSLKNYVFSKEMYRGAVVSEDGTATAIMFTLLPDADKQAVAKEIKDKIEALDLPETIYFGGLPMMMNDINDLIISDIVWLVPIVFLVIALILLLSFKSFRGVLLPLLTAGLAVVWTIGIMAVAGYEMTIISNIIPVVLLAVGSAYTIHVINSINHNKLADRKQALVQALRYILVPVILAAVTTAIGFVSFVFGAYLTMIKDFGIFTAVGTLIALILSLFFVPALISGLSMYSKKTVIENEEKQTILTNKILLPLVKFLFKHSKYTLIGWGVLLMLCIGGISLIKTSVNMADYFKKDNPTRVAEDVMQKKFGGSLPVFVVFEGDMQSPEVLKMMISTEHFMKEDPNIEITQSVADLIEQMNDAMGEGEKIPGERAKIEQLWFLLDGQEIMPQLVNDNLSKGIIQSKFASVDSKELEVFTAKMNRFIEENPNEHCKIELTGMPSVYVKLNSSLINSQYNSLLIAIIMVILIVGLILRSASKGIFAAIPVVATIIILFGFMGITGIPLDIATVLVASIALGIGIDYSIHVITGFNKHLISHGDAEKAIEETILLSGKAVIINVISVSAGFLVLLFSQIVPLQNFGLLVAISMFGSGFGALTLLPVILILVNRKRKIITNNH